MMFPADDKRGCNIENKGDKGYGEKSETDGRAFEGISQ
jgi:hypothetical protein